MNDDRSPSDRRTKESDDAKMRMLAATAFHEAGHAVMALSLGRSVEKLTIVPGQLQFGGTRLGVCKMQKGRGNRSKDRMEEDVLVLLAGMVAEARLTGSYSHAGAGEDLRTVQRLLESRSASQRQIDKWQRRLLNKTEHLLADDANSKAVESIAAELLEKNTISGRAARHIYHQTQQQYS
ncbi:MAG: cell division protein FtsH [Pirellulaceae bacterium]|nr:cell division protein FtsH [Pirellulaceae bacterium]